MHPFRKWFLRLELSITVELIVLRLIPGLLDMPLRSYVYLWMMFSVLVVLPLSWTAGDSEKHVKERQERIDSDPEAWDEYQRLRRRFR